MIARNFRRWPASRLRRLETISYSLTRPRSSTRSRAQSATRLRERQAEQVLGPAGPASAPATSVVEQPDDIAHGLHRRLGLRACALAAVSQHRIDIGMVGGDAAHLAGNRR